MFNFENSVGVPWVDLNGGEVKVDLNLNFGHLSNDQIGGALLILGVVGFFATAGQHHKYAHADTYAFLSLVSAVAGGGIAVLG